MLDELQRAEEAAAMRAYFDAHQSMESAITPEAFGHAYVRANIARDTLVRLAALEAVGKKEGMDR